MIYRKWNVKKVDNAKVNNICNKFNISKLLGKLLVSREIDDEFKVKDFIEPENNLPDPLSLKDMEKLVERVVKAVDTGEKIVVYGDYDVDGITSTALMVTYLESLGAQVFYKLPIRTQEGYGLSKQVIADLAEKNVNLIITVDNGITAHNEIEYANSLGIDVVVTDHHLPQDTLPNAIAVVDPLRKDDTSDAKKFSGVGVAYMAICAIEGVSAYELLDYYSDLVAIGTIADIMELKGANRSIVKAGLELLQDTDRAGITALIEQCSLTGKTITSENISYTFSPRLNASGRMDDAVVSLDLLLEEDLDIARSIAKQLEEYNNERQKSEAYIIKNILEQIDSDKSILNDSILVICGENYHQGVLGIVASRLVDKYHKSSIVLTIDEKGEAKGSGRSIDGFPLHDALKSCASLLERFGGHSRAAGLALKPENLQEFKKQINAWAKNNYPVIKHNGINIDACVNLKEMNIEDVEQISLLEPFGQGNPSPLFVLENLKLEAIYPISEGKHCRMKFSQDNNTFFAIMFGMSPENMVYKIGDKVDIIVSISIYKGQTKLISGKIKELRPYTLNDAYIDYVELYESYSNKIELSKNELIKICPSREDIVNIYKEICNKSINLSDLKPIFKKTGEENSGKILIALDVLIELGHIEIRKENSILKYVKAKETKPKPLTDSVLLNNLQAKIK